MRALWPHISFFMLGLVLIPSLIMLRYSVHLQSDSSIKLIPRSVKNLTSNLFLSESKNNSATSEAAEKICARNRWVIKKALRDSQDKSLNLFSLISKGLLKEMPNCPDGGNYELEKSEETRIRCSRHGITPDR